MARAAPKDRLVRYHARQANFLVCLLWLLIALLGFVLAMPATKDFVAAAAGTVLGFGLVAIAVGVLSAARGRFVRLRPLWDVLALFSGSQSRRTPPP